MERRNGRRLRSAAIRNGGQATWAVLALAATARWRARALDADERRPEPGSEVVVASGWFGPRDFVEPALTGPVLPCNPRRCARS